MSITASRIVSLLSDGRELTVFELATELGVHENTVRNNLDKLTIAKQVERLPGHTARYRMPQLANLDTWAPNESIVTQLKIAYEERANINMASYVEKHGYDKAINLLKNFVVFLEREQIVKEFQ